MATSKAVHETHERMVHRLVFFSDAVFAIVLTLLVLELRPPHVEADGDLGPALAGMLPHFIAFPTSFALVSVFWIAHMWIMRRLVVFDWPVACLNLVFLFTIALMPFVSAMIGEFNVYGLAWRLYCLVLILASISQSVLLVAVLRDKGRLMGGASGRDLGRALTRALSPGVAFAIGLALSLAGQTRAAVYCWVLIPVIMLSAPFLFRVPKRTGPKSPAPAPARAKAPAKRAPPRPRNAKR